MCIMMNRGTKNACFHINKTTLPIKVVYFTSVSAIGTLVPYVPVFMKELGLSSTETGILYGIMPFISFFTRPLFGAVADKLRKHKLVLVICLLSMGLFYGLLLVTPSKTTTADCVVLDQSLSECILNKTQYHCFQANQNGTKELRISLCNLNVVCNNELTQNVSDLEQERIDFTCFTGTNVHCHSYKTSGWMLQCYNQSGDFGKTFVIFFIIYLFANISFSSIYNLLDAMAYNILDDRRDLWGRQRLWGTVGFAIFALVSSFITGMRSEDHQITKADYSISFYIFIGLCIISAIVVSFLRLSESIECKHLLENVTHLLRYPEVVAFMIVITFIGIFFSVIQGFLFWYLRDIGSTQLNLGLCILTNSIAEIAMLAISGRMIKYIGHAACLYIALASYAARFLSFSFITSPWIAPVIELLHGFCFGLMYDAASEYASIIAPIGMAATVQGLIGGLYFGFGRGIGGLVTGKLFDPASGIGDIWTFRLYGALSLLLLVVYVVINTAIFCRPILVPRNMSIEITAENTADIPEESKPCILIAVKEDVLEDSHL